MIYTFKSCHNINFRGSGSMSLLPVITSEIIQVSFKARFTKQATHGQRCSADIWEGFFMGKYLRESLGMSKRKCLIWGVFVRNFSRGFIFHAGNVQRTVHEKRSQVLREWGHFSWADFFHAGNVHEKFPRGMSRLCV